MTIYLFALLHLFSCGQTDSNSKTSNSFHTLKIVNPDSTLVTGYYLIVDSSGYKRQLEKTLETIYLNPTPILTAGNISSMEILEREMTDYTGPSTQNGHIPTYYVLKFKFDSNGICAWAIAIVNDTVSYRRVAFVLNDKVIQTQQFNLKTEAIIQGANWDTKDDLEKIKKTIETENKK